MATFACYVAFLGALLLYHMIVAVGQWRIKKALLDPHAVTNADLRRWRSIARHLLLTEVVLGLCGLQILRRPENGLFSIPLFIGLMALAALGDLARAKMLVKRSTEIRPQESAELPAR